MGSTPVTCKITRIEKEIKMNATEDKKTERSAKSLEIDNFVDSKTKDEVLVKHTATIVWLEKVNMEGKIDKRPCQKAANTERLKETITSFEKDVDNFVALVEDKCGPAIEINYQAAPFCKSEEMIKALMDSMPSSLIKSLLDETFNK